MQDPETSELVETDASQMRLVARCDLKGFGNGGEGLGLHDRAGRRTLFLAHESAPKNFTAVDVTDPRRPQVLTQTELPHPRVRSNSLAVCGNLMAVAYQVQTPGLEPAGLEVFDISDPARPRSVSFFDASGPHSRGVHFVWWADGETAYLATGIREFEPTHPLDDQFVLILDLRDPSRPREVGRWWLPGTRVGDSASPPVRHPRFDGGFRAHNVNVYPERPDRAYVGYLDAGALILDIGDPARPRLVARLDLHPPLPGFTHTVLPLFDRGLIAMTDESTVDGGADYPKLLWVVDSSYETNLVPLGTAPLPPREEFAGRGGRYGAHNLHENDPVPTAWRSDDVVVGAFFNAGLRAFDLADPFHPREIARLVPAPPSGSSVGAIQMNDVYVDERGIIYALDRFTGGLYVAEAGW
jgi:hypothetical protein